METTERGAEPRVTLYESVAARMADLIERGTFAPGTRVPSVRALSRQWEVSITTILEAYRLLEDRGLIEARPQSGYYVTARFSETPPEPEISHPEGDATEVSVGELVMRVVRDTRDPSLLHLGAAIPDPSFLPLERLNRILARVAREHGRKMATYDVPPGCEPLRVQIARRALAAGCALSPAEIVTTCGCQEALLLSLRAVCRPGDTVAVESPTYYGLLQALEMLDLRALEIPTHPRDGVSLEALHYALEVSPVRACLIATNFSNPLGCSLPDEKKQELVAMLERREIPLIEDDVYGDLCFTAERPRTAKGFDRKGLVLLCSSFSKTLSSGCRVGWVAPGRFQATVERLKFVNTIATPTLPQYVAAEFLGTGGYDRHLRTVRRAYARQVALMAQAVGRHFPPGTRVTRPAGGFVLWVEMPLEVDSLRLYEQALQARISIAPGPLFSATGKYRHCIRLNAAYWSADVEAAIARLGELATKQLDDRAAA